MWKLRQGWLDMGKVRCTGGHKDCEAGEGRGRWSWPAQVWFTFLTHSYSPLRTSRWNGKMSGVTTDVVLCTQCIHFPNLFASHLYPCYTLSCPLLHGVQRQDEWEANWPRTSLCNRESSSVSLWASYLWNFGWIFNRSSYNSLWKQPVFLFLSSIITTLPVVKKSKVCSNKWRNTKVHNSHTPLTVALWWFPPLKLVKLYSAFFFLFHYVNFPLFFRSKFSLSLVT